jgi:myo-inositol 2-dehydrogenase/D-chiro-inositol 1-dehydrogenase
VIRFALFGAGRIGAMHAANLAASPDARLVCVHDPVADAAAEVAGRHAVQAAGDVEAALNAGVDAVLIASSTNTHVELITAAARAGKAVFCEKPIDLSLQRVAQCWDAVRGCGVPIQIGFNRRYDASHRRVRDLVAGGEIGSLQQVIITSRDPEPPPLSYARVSGGLFRDMMIHDFDLARFVLGEEPTSITAIGSALVDPAIGDLDDVDTAMVMMATASGVQCHINCSRQAAYGYDQRLEVHGSLGMVCSGNRLDDEARLFTAAGAGSPAPLKRFFIERYAAAYQAELADFIDAVAIGREPSVTFADGHRALELAEAALRSLQTGSTVPVPGSVPVPGAAGSVSGAVR